MNGNIVKFINANDPSNVDYSKYGIKDALLIDNTGIASDEKGLAEHLKNKEIKKVLLTAPVKDGLKNIVYGVNHDDIHDTDKIIGAASCTTNCLAPVADVINKNFIIVNGFMTTIHAFTSDQRILDNSHKDLRRARSANQSIVPTSTGASKTIGEIIPSLNGKLEGIAMRVPTPNVSIIEFVFNVKKNVTKYVVPIIIHQKFRDDDFSKVLAIKIIT